MKRNISTLLDRSWEDKSESLEQPKRVNLRNEFEMWLLFTEIKYIIFANSYSRKIRENKAL